MTKLDNLVKIIEEELQPQKKASTKNHDDFTTMKTLRWI